MKAFDNLLYCLETTAWRGYDMSHVSKPPKLGIFWSHNNRGGSRWLSEFIKACQTQEFVWWDVGWRIKFSRLSLPTIGYLWTTADQQVLHSASIQPESTMVFQPDKTLARKVEAEWIRLRLPFSTNDPLHKYLRNERETLTLLKLSIEKLKTPKGLSNFTLWDGRPVAKPPYGFYYISV